MTTLVTPVWFGQFGLDLGKKVHDLSSDTLKLGLITTGPSLSFSLADPRWGSGGSTDLSAYQVSTAGTSYTGPITLQYSAGGAGSQSWALSTGVPQLKLDIVTIAQDASGPSNIYAGIIFNDTAAGKQACGYVPIDAGGNGTIVDDQMVIRWNNGSPYVAFQLPQYSA